MSSSRRRRALTKERDKRKEARARQTQAAQHEAASRRPVSPGAYRVRRTIGWSLVALGILVGVTHWMEHLQLFSIASEGIQDVALGYPMALLLGIGGSIVLSR